MKHFMDADFLLTTDTAKTLFHTYAEGCPIIDYHNHLSPKDICEHRRFENLTQVWLEGDHYKWRAMRACGVDERYITGDAGDEEKFMAWASVVPLLIGNPLYHWAHLELQRYFGIYEPLNERTAREIWEKSGKLLAGEGFDVVSLLKKQNVWVLCTTDDPADDLAWHDRIRGDAAISFKVLPSFRPDRFLHITSEGWKEAVACLGERYNVEIRSFDGLVAALAQALEFFCGLGCKVSDHGLPVLRYGRGNADTVFDKVMVGGVPTADEVASYQGALLRRLAAEYKAHGVTMQLHLGPIRNNSPRLRALVGADAGGDSVGLTTDPVALAGLLGDLEAAETLPNTILYNMNAADNTVLSTMAGNFAPKVQFGAAWWFNDTMRGIRTQLDELLETGQLARSVGMLTDSRSFTSFPRHEYYRRILCGKLGELVEDGQYPDDMAILGRIVSDVCFDNARRFFGFSD